MQERLMLRNLKEAFKFYKEYHSHLSIEFLKFAILYPNQCTLSVCVYVTHQNVKLLIIGGCLNPLPKDT